MILHFEFETDTRYLEFNIICGRSDAIPRVGEVIQVPGNLEPPFVNFRGQEFTIESMCWEGLDYDDPIVNYILEE